MNYTKASEAPNGTDVPLVVKLPVAIAEAARVRVQAGDLAAAKVLVHLDRVTYAVRYPLLVAVTVSANDVALLAAVDAMWATIQAVANGIV